VDDQVSPSVDLWKKEAETKQYGGKGKKPNKFTGNMGIPGIVGPFTQMMATGENPKLPLRAKIKWWTSKRGSQKTA